MRTLTVDGKILRLLTGTGDDHQEEISSMSWS